MTAQPRSNDVHTHHPAVIARLGVAVIALLLGACQAPAAASPAAASPSAPPIALVSDAPPIVTSAPPSVEPSAPPPATPAPTPTPAKATWSQPTKVKGFDNCWSVVAGIDDRGSRHLVATCGYQDGMQVRYAVSTDGTTWKTIAWTPPASRLEDDPQLAISGKTLYLAYTRQAPTDGGCGDDGLDDVGVYYRTRTLPSGDWSAPKRIGGVGDHLQSFRVSGSVLHVTVTTEKDAATMYETQTGDTLRRYTIGDASGQTSLRVGDDGKGRIAYESTHGISYGMVNGDRFSSARIPNSTNGWDPVLTLAPGNVAYVLWNRSYHGIGCAGPDAEPEDGTYFATNAGGTWTSSRLTPLVGGASLTLDPATGELHALVVDSGRIVYFHRAPGQDWTHETAVRTSGSSVQIRQGPHSGALFAAYVAYPDEGEPYVLVTGQH